jgi:hypothetical protein
MRMAIHNLFIPRCETYCVRNQCCKTCSHPRGIGSWRLLSSKLQNFQSRKNVCVIMEAAHVLSCEGFESSGSGFLTV